MPRAARVCSAPGCPNLTEAGRCTACRRDADRARGTAAERGYTAAGHRDFRDQVLARHPVCMLCHRARATVADHWPVSRRDLELAGLDPNDPRHGRGLCARCHSRETARLQPGGWAAGPGG